MSRNIDEYKINTQMSNGHSVKYSASDIFLNKLDVTWMGGMPDNSYENTYSIIPIEPSHVDDGTVVYKYNKQGFRSDDFVAHDNRDGHILFGGCSQTEGVGGNMDTVWTKMLHDKLSTKNNISGLFSIARSGYGWQKIINNFMIYIEQYGMPEYFFVMLPNLARFYEWSTQDGRWFYVQRYPLIEMKNPTLNKQSNPDQNIMEESLSVEEHRRSFIDFMSSWKLFEKFCETNNVKLLWASWDFDENINHKEFTLSENYIHLSTDEFEKFIFNDIGNKKPSRSDYFRRRDGHDGVIYHKYWTEKFLQEISKRGWLNV